MSPLTTFYILAGIVGLAVLVFIVMIVVTALRPPELPDLRFEPPPLQRMIRALTPLPFATTTPMPARRPTPVPAAVPSVSVSPPAVPTTAARSAAAPRLPGVAAPHAPAVAAVRPPFVAANAQTIAAPGAPVVASSRAAVAFTSPAPVGATSPALVAATPRAAVAAPSHAPLAVPSPGRALPARPVAVSARVGIDRSGEIRRPIYPHRRSRTLVRILVALFVTLTLASGAVIAFPSLIDPLCDDYEWFGAEAASVVRHYACDAHNAIYDLVENL